MKDSLTSNNWGDFRQRYNGTIGFLNTEAGEKVLVRVNSVDETRVKFTDVEGTAYYANADKGVEFDFIPVKRAWYNTSEGPVYLERVPARQWRRGIHPENTTAFGMDSMGLVPRSVDIKLISSIHVSDAEYKYAGGKPFALSSVFAVDARNALYCYMQKIGSITTDLSIKLDNQVFAQELRDCIRRNNLPFKV